METAPKARYPSGRQPSRRCRTTPAPDDFYAHYNLGLAHLTLGDNTRAIEQFRQALAIDPNSADARQNLAAARAAEQVR
jgi:Flp pilus assembly protein TadD